MQDRLDDGDATEPAMQEIESIKGNVQEQDQRIVASGHDEEWHHIDHGQDAGPIAKGGQEDGLAGVPVDAEHAEENVGGEVGKQEKRLEAEWNGAPIESGSGNLCVVAVPEEWSVQKVLLEFGQSRVGRDKVALGVVVEAGHRADVSVCADDDVVDKGSANGGDQDQGQVDVVSLILHLCRRRACLVSCGAGRGGISGLVSCGRLLALVARDQASDRQQKGPVGKEWHGCRERVVVVLARSRRATGVMRPSGSTEMEAAASAIKA